MLSLVVPIKDEKENLVPLVHEIRAALEGIGRPYEILLVDDGSTDGSRELIRAIAAEDSFVRGIFLERHYGQTAAFLAGFDRARGEILVTLDADLQNDPGDIPALVDALKTADMAIGYRVKRRDGIVKRISSRVANAVRSRVLKDSVRDIGCSLKVYRREVASAFPPYAGMHRFLPVLAKMNGFRVVELPVNHRPRKAGRSKYGTLDRLVAGTYDMLALRWMRKRLLRYNVVEEVPQGEGSAHH